DWRVFLGLSYLALWGACLIRAGRRPREVPDEGMRAPALALLWCLASVPWVFLFALSVKPLTPVFHARYVLFGLPALITLLAVGAHALPRRWQVAAIVALVLGHAWAFPRMWTIGFWEYKNKFSMNSIAKEVRASAKTGEKPLIVATEQFQFFD